VLVVGLWSPAASAQFRTADSEMKKVKESAEGLDALIGRRATEEQAILDRTKQRREACVSANAALANLFESLEKAAPGETRLSEPARLARNLTKQLVNERELIARCTAVIDLIDTPKLKRAAD